ncbi:MAG: hypothetical protein NPIRA03_21730 [Nitrospirales bacterium]|nr:MAG: hypothetical protein NPIRA03_21730 [Nitrospirales bacterium]
MTPQKTGTQFISIRDILTLFFKHKNKILGIFVGAVAIAVGTAFLMTPVYQAQSSVMVKMGRENVYHPEVGAMNPEISVDQKSMIESEVQILLTRDLTKRVLEVLDVGVVYPGIAETAPEKFSALDSGINEMRKNLSVSKVSESNIIQITFLHRQPEIAEKVVNLLVDLLLEKHLEIFSNPKGMFLSKQLHDYEQKLHNSKSQLQEFKHQNKLTHLDEEKALLLGQRNELNTIQKNLQNKENGLKSKYESLKEQIKNVPKHVALSSVSEQQKVIDGAQANLLQLGLEEQRLLSKYHETSRFVVNIRNEIKLVEQFIKNQQGSLNDKVTKGINPVYQGLEVELLTVESELNAHASQINEVTFQLKKLYEQLAKLDFLEKEFETLQMKVDSDKNNYKMYLTKVEEAKVSEAMDQLKMANISVIQPATMPMKPVKPQKGLILFLGIMIGGVSAILWVIASEYLESGYSRPEYASHDLGLPILTSITYKNS